MDDYAFEVYGNLGGRPVRKCLNCGAGIRVTILPPRFRRLSDAEWAEFKVRFESWRDEDRARTRAWREEQDARRQLGPEELTERVLADLLDVEAKAGGPQQYPVWAIRQFVKSTVITEAAPVRTPTVAEAFDDSSPEKSRYEQVLDQVLEDEGLTSIAEEVFAAVTLSPDQIEQMSDEEWAEWREGRSDS
jgi:hypothetical protein